MIRDYSNVFSIIQSATNNDPLSCAVTAVVTVDLITKASLDIAPRSSSIAVEFSVAASIVALSFISPGKQPSVPS